MPSLIINFKELYQMQEGSLGLVSIKNPTVKHAKDIDEVVSIFTPFILQALLLQTQQSTQLNKNNLTDEERQKLLAKQERQLLETLHIIKGDELHKAVELAYTLFEAQYIASPSSSKYQELLTYLLRYCRSNAESESLQDIEYFKKYFLTEEDEFLTLETKPEIERFLVINFFFLFTGFQINRALQAIAKINNLGF